MKKMCKNNGELTCICGKKTCEGCIIRCHRDTIVQTPKEEKQMKRKCPKIKGPVFCTKKECDPNCKWLQMSEQEEEEAANLLDAEDRNSKSILLLE